VTGEIKKEEKKGKGKRIIKSKPKKEKSDKYLLDGHKVNGFHGKKKKKGKSKPISSKPGSEWHKEWHKDSDQPSASIVIWVSIDGWEAPIVELHPHLNDLGADTYINRKETVLSKPQAITMGQGDLMLCHPRLPYRFLKNNSGRKQRFVLLNFCLLRDVPSKAEYHAHARSGKLVQRIYYKVRDATGSENPLRDYKRHPDSDEVLLEERPTFTELDAPYQNGAALGLNSSPFTPRKLAPATSRGPHSEHESRSIMERFEQERAKRTMETDARPATAPMPVGGFRMVISAV